MTTPRPRILFVDDDQALLDGLAGSLWRLRKAWDMRFVCGGAAALAILEAIEFDAVVSDMRMPNIDGEAVLRATLAGSPGTIRVILSGQTDRTVVTRATSVAHQFLSKPCSTDELRECLERMLDCRRSMEPALRDVVCAVGHLPISPRALEGLNELFRQPSFAIADLNGCIEDDVGLTAMVLHVATAGFYARRQPAESVAQAVAVVGVDAVRTFVTQVAPLDPPDGAVRVFDHALATGKLMARLSSDPRAHLAGVLHGLGKLIMLRRFGADYARLLAEVATDETSPLCELEVRRFGIGHAAVGAALVALWGLSPELGRVLRSHATPAPDDDLAVALHAACVLSKGLIRIDARVANDERIAGWRALAAEA